MEVGVNPNASCNSLPVILIATSLSGFLGLVTTSLSVIHMVFQELAVNEYFMKLHVLH